MWERQFTSWGGAVLLVDCQSMAEVGWQMGIPYYSLPTYLPTIHMCAG